MTTPPMEQLAMAAEMLTAYVAAIKASGEYERWHYIPEVEDLAAEFYAKSQQAAEPSETFTADEVHAYCARAREEARAEAGKDAERYRKLRRGQRWSVIDGIGDTLRAEALDAAIDAAMRGEKADNP